MPDHQDGIVRAAGGVVVRNHRARGDGELEIVVIYRARYDDWSLPKGKLDPGESEEAAALREVEEETGLRCRTVRFLTTVSYADRRGRTKTVAYWLMEPVEGELRAEREIDDVLWARAADAASVLTYPRDVELVEEALAGGAGA
ncbi:MAG TPA: NUDIX hydrolase [Actinomycetota bacterium]|jgi:8-oxo-dGTP diphosphatase